MEYNKKYHKLLDGLELHRIGLKSLSDVSNDVNIEIFELTELFKFFKTWKHEGFMKYAKENNIELLKEKTSEDMYNEL